ncbi:DUF4124 domain-containing protein [Derxia lacustris]|uniref:DUF4124 domain-containing protein n=1 Tax=Derxia lacustris TaxID=764842 RepID=UPI000A174D10|nr:DUF4124 domain-containing protein [Derxia lacustris]
MSRRLLVAGVLFSTNCIVGSLAVLGRSERLPNPVNRDSIVTAPAVESEPADAPMPAARPASRDAPPSRPRSSIWRCTDAHGSTSYSNFPCANGKSRSVDVRDPLRGWDGARDLAEAQRKGGGLPSAGARTAPDIAARRIDAAVEGGSR